MKSDNARVGMQQAPARSLFNALGFTQDEMKKPMVGIVSSYNEIVPGHMNIDKIVEAVRVGVAEAGGVPVVFPAIAVCDGIAMGHVGMKYSLVTRDLVADSTECMAIAHQFDALVMVPNCDKNVPGLLMAAARLDLPTVFVSGGPMLAGHIHGHKTSLSSMFEAVGAYAAGKLDEDGVLEYEKKVCPTCGSCSGMYTANSMNCLTEALGMGLPGNGTIPAVYSERIRLAKMAGYAVMDMYNKGITARQIMTKESILNALTVDMALGCSTNSMLHLPAIAHEIGFDFDISFANPISEKTPNLCHLAPAGPTYMEDLNEAGGVYAVMNELKELDLLNLDCMTVTGKTIGEAIKNASLEELQSIREIGEIVSQSVYDFFRDPKVCEQLELLRQEGLNFTQPKKQLTSQVLAGKTFVFTGELSTLKRTEAEQLAKEYGGYASSSVSKKTSYVVAGENAGTKLRKANELGVPVITEEEFLKMIGR